MHTSTCPHTCTLKRPCGSQSAFAILAACATRPPGTRERERARDRGTSTCTFACVYDRSHDSQFWQLLRPPACVGNASARTAAPRPHRAVSAARQRTRHRTFSCTFICTQSHVHARAPAHAQVYGKLNLNCKEHAHFTGMDLHVRRCFLIGLNPQSGVRTGAAVCAK